MNREGFSKSKISQYLAVNRILSMDELQFEAFVESLSQRSKELSFYEDWVKAKLEMYQETSAAQMHDWLMEHFPDFPGVTAKTVYNFVMWVRQKHHLPQTRPIREYNAVEISPSGIISKSSGLSRKNKNTKMVKKTPIISAIKSQALRHDVP